MGFTYFYWVLLGFAELFLRSRCTFFYLCFLLGWNAAPAGSVCCFFFVFRLRATFVVWLGLASASAHSQVSNSN